MENGSKKKMWLVLIAVGGVLFACASVPAGLTQEEFCSQQNNTDYETCMSDMQDCADINGGEPTVQCMGQKGYTWPPE